MVTFPIACSDDYIRAAVVGWSELLAQQKYAEAIAMFRNFFDIPPSVLEQVVSEYHKRGSCKVTSIFDLPEVDVPAFIVKSIAVQRHDDLSNCLGFVDYDNVPIDGSASDLTAQFEIVKLDESTITLSFKDMHVL